MARYRRPGWLTRNVMNAAVTRLTRLGVSVAGSRVLRVRGRRSGQWRENPVNLLTFNGERYLVAPRGETDWVRNMRAAGGGELVLGRHVDPFRAVELPEEERVPVLREYLRRWRAESGVFFGGVTANSPEQEFRRIAPEHPVFRIGSSPPDAE